MRIKKQWDWDRATQGMRVLLADLGNAKTINGVIAEVKRSNKRRMIDGRPVQSTQVSTVTVLCDDGTEIVVSRDNCQYQITLK